MKLKVKVTEQIIKDSASCPTKAFLGVHESFSEEAHRELVRNCMVSLAVRDIFPEAQTLRTYLVTGNDRDLIALPKHISNIITGFDNMTPKERRRIQPFDFEIDVPYEVIDKIGISEVYKKLSESPTLELVSIN